LNEQKGATYSAARIAARLARLGKEISRECEGSRLDVVVTMDHGSVFAADLIRQIDAPMVCHFFRDGTRPAFAPDYFGFRTASNQVWVGYGLAAPKGMGRNHKRLSSGTNHAFRKSGKGRKKKA